MLYTICIALILVASVLIILAVLVQNPKSGMAANFGASNQVMGVRETTNFLEKFTWTMAIAILVLSLVATLAMDKGLVAHADELDAILLDSCGCALQHSQRGVVAAHHVHNDLHTCFLLSGGLPYRAVSSSQCWKLATARSACAM